MAEFPKEYFYLENMSFDQFPGKISENTPTGGTNSDPYGGIMLDDGIYSPGLDSAQMGYATPPPTLTYGDDSLATGLENMNLDTFETDLNLGDLPVELTSMVNSILNDDVHFGTGNLTAYECLDLDTASATWPSTDLTEDMFLKHDMGPIDSTLQEIQSLAMGGATALLPQTSRRKPRKQKVNVSTMNEIPATATFNYETYPSLDDLRVASPTSSGSYHSDTGSSNEEPQRPRQRRPRVSYSTLTEEEKYKRIRDLNNEASKIYREKQRKLFLQAADQLPALTQKNQNLRHKAVALEKLRDQMKTFADTFLKQQMTQTDSFNQF